MELKEGFSQGHHVWSCALCDAQLQGMLLA